MKVSVVRSGPLFPDLFTARVSDDGNHTIYCSRVHNLRIATRCARWYASYFNIPLRRTKVQTSLIPGVEEQVLK